MKTKKAAAKDPNEEIAACVLQLQEVQNRLQELTGGETDAVIYPGGKSYLLQEAQEKLRESEAAQRGFAAMQSSILNALPAHIALIDHEGVILSINDGWQGFAQGNAFQNSACGVGQNYLEICDQAHGDCSEEAFRTAAGIRALLAGTIGEFELEYPCHGPTEQRWFRLMITPLEREGAKKGAVIMHINITDRKLAEEAVRMREEQFRNMFNAAATGIAVSTPQGRFLQVNASYCRMLGYTQEELLELNFAALTHPDDLSLNLDLRDELVAGKRESFVMEKRYLKKNGDIVWTRHSVSATHATGGEIATLMVVAEDITERKQAMDELQRRENELRVLFDLTPAMLCFKDTENVFLRVNQRLAKTTGRPIEQIEGKPAAEIFPQEAAKYFQDDLEVIQSRTPKLGIVEKLQASENRELWVQTDKVPVCDNDGKVIGIIVMVQDITERKQAEAALRYSEERLRLITDLVPHGIFAKDSAGRHIFANPALAEMAGFSVEEIIGKDDFDLVASREEAEAYRAADRAVMQSGSKKVISEEPRTDLSGRTRLLQTIKVPFTVPETGERAVLGVCMDITERKRAEEELLRRQTELQVLFDLMPAMIWFKDTKNGILRINRRAADATGKPVEELEGRSMSEVYPQEAAKYYADDLEVIGTGAPKLEIVERFQGGDGREIWIQTDKVPVCGKDGNTIGIVVMAQDITERKQAEESLALFRNLVDGSPDAIEVIDPETGRFLDVNTTGCTRLGYSREEMLSLELADIDVEKDYRTLWPLVVEEIKKAGFAAIIGRHRRKDGTTFPVEVNARYISLNRGYMVAVVRDITERKKNEERIRRLVDSNVQGVFFWNTKGEIIEANDAFLGLVDYTREDLKAGRVSWAKMTPPEFVERDQRALKECATGGVCENYEKEYFRKDGTRVPVLIGAAMFDDNPEDGVCFVVDLTERKKLEQQFLRAQRMESIGTLAGGVAHDLNNILAPIMMSIHLLKDFADGPEAKDILETIEASAKRGADIVKQVLSFARGLEGERVEVQPRDLLKDLETIIRDTFPRDIRMQFSIPHNAWMILGDPTQMHQILLNLSINARDAMPGGGSLTISVENCTLDEHYAAMNSQARAGRYILISVTDSGTGMPPELLDKIFEPFFTTKERGQGTGLGLSTVFAIVKSHGGFINVYSEVGKGTNFKIYLPAVETSSDEQRKLSQQVSMPRGKGETVLVIDDENSILTITSKTLQSFGYKVLTATDGADGMAVYLEHKADIAVVLTDMMMPIMDGPATIHALTRIDPNLKIIAASGLNTHGEITKVTGMGIKHFLTKPYTASILLKTLRAMLDKG